MYSFALLYFLLLQWNYILRMIWSNRHLNLLQKTEAQLARGGVSFYPFCAILYIKYILVSVEGL